MHANYFVRVDVAFLVASGHISAITETHVIRVQYQTLTSPIKVFHSYNSSVVLLISYCIQYNVPLYGLLYTSILVKEVIHIGCEKK